MRTSTPAKGCPQLPCLPVGQVDDRGARRSTARTSRSSRTGSPAHRARAARAAGSTAARLPGPRLDRSAVANRGCAREPRGLVGPAAEERHPLALEEVERALGLGHRFGEQRRAGDEHAQQTAREPTGPEERHRDVEAVVGADAPRVEARRHRARARRRGCGRRPSARPRLPDVKSTTKSSAGRTASSSASTSASSTRRVAGRSSTNHTCAEEREHGCRRPASVAVAMPGATASRSSRYERPRNERASTRWVTPATRSCASSSGGRSSVLSGTSTPPTRSTAAAITAHSMPFGSEQPDPRALADPGRDEPRGERAALVVELGVRDRRGHR